MHLTGEASGGAGTMSTTSLSASLRRQAPVSTKPPTRPPRLRIGTSHNRIGGLMHKQHKLSTTSQSNGRAEVTAESSKPDISYKGDRSRHLIATGQLKRRSLSVDSSLNSSRLVIHHQRHNLKNRFQLLKTLGEGTYGKVKLAVERTTGEQVAIKYIKKTKILDDADLVRIRREIQILSSLRHKHIVNIREVFEKKDKIVLVMDYAQGGELYDYLNKLGQLGEKDARRVFRQIVSAIHYCHKNGIVHRDLKLENIILDDEGNVKIADFGLSNYFSHNDTLQTFCGSPLYASPEIVNGKPYHGPEVDVWSLGVILYTLVYGSMPFESNNLSSLKQQISEGDYSQPSHPSDAAGLIRHMLTVTPSRRATIEDALRHWWVNFGHSTMPNDEVYSPDDEPPVMAYTLSVTDSYLEPLAVIHQRNQSSLSSDSDIELDFRPTRWSSRRRLPLDSTGSSLSSSVGGSPAPTPDSGCLEDLDVDDDDDPAAIASGLLKLPPDVLDILKGCRSKSLAALLNQGKVSSGFESDINSKENLNGNLCTKGEAVKPNSCEKLSPTNSVFDSERKPARSILKRKGKFSGDDGGCMVNDDLSSTSEKSIMPKAGHLPRRMPSFKDEANGIFSGRHRASRLLENSPQRDSWGCATSQTTKCHLQHPTDETETHQAPNEFDNLSPKVNPVNHSNPICQNHLSPHDYSVNDSSRSQPINPHQSNPHQSIPQQPNPNQPNPHQNINPNLQQNAHSIIQHQNVQCPKEQQNPHRQTQYLNNINSSSNVLNGNFQSNVSNISNCDHQSQHFINSIDLYNTVPSSQQGVVHPSSVQVNRSSVQMQTSSVPHHTMMSQADLTKPMSYHSNNSNSEFCNDYNSNPSSNSTSHHTSFIDKDPAQGFDKEKETYSNNSNTNNYVPKIIHVKQLSDSQTSKIVWRPKSILKNFKPSQMEEARNRLSISSIGSNSSADLLDLSYDSGDSDHFINLGFDVGHGVPQEISCPKTSTEVDRSDLLSNSTDWSRQSTWSSEQRTGGQTWSCDQAENGVKYPDLSLAFEGLTMTSEDEGRDLLDKSSILYQLTREANGLL